MNIVENLKKAGFFSLNNLEQSQFLRQHGFFNLNIEKRKEFLEELGLFYLDVNDDPPDLPLEAKDVDYLKKVPINQKKNEVSNSWKNSFINNALKSGNLSIEKVNGIDNVLNTKSGSIITVNHFNPLDTFMLEKIFKINGIDKKIYKVIKEGNFTNFPGKFGLYFKYDNTLPLSRLPETMELFDEALEEILEKGDIIIVCPEQSMWLNYRQPRPFKYGAFKWATVNDVPVIPTFITISDQDINKQAYTINIGAPIYPDIHLSPKDNIHKMRNLDYMFCDEVYRSVYGKPIKYKTIDHENLPEYVTTTPNFEKAIKNKNIEIKYDER